MRRVTILLGCCLSIGLFAALGIVVGHANSPVIAAAQPLPVAPLQLVPTPTHAAPSPRPGRTTVTDPFATIDADYARLGKDIDDLKAKWPKPVPTPTPSPSPSPSPTPPPPPGPSARFPGDPGPGHIVVGAIVSGAAGDAAGFEKATGAKLGAHRTYFHAGISDLAVNGPAMQFIKAEQAAGRLPEVSVKLGPWGPIAAGQFDTQIKAFRDAVEALPKPVDLIVHHEPQNDLGTYGTAAQFVAAQEHIRQVIGSNLRRLSFGGSLMTYGWTSQGIAKFGPVDSWFPKPGTWDWVGGDQYAQQAGAPIDDAKLAGFIASCKQHGVIPAITELGIRSSDPDGPAKLRALFEKLIGAGFVKVIWYDSTNNSTQNGWVLTPGPLRDEFVAMLEDPRAVRPAA